MAAKCEKVNKLSYISIAGCNYYQSGDHERTSSTPRVNYMTATDQIFEHAGKSLTHSETFLGQFTTKTDV